MAIDKNIDYVIQDGYNNYTKNSKSVTVPKKFKARKNAPATKLAYITEAEAKQLKKQNPGTPHKGPSGVPSYDSFDAEGNYSSGAAMSAAETGGSTDRDRRDMAEAGISPQEAQAIRTAAINAGAGQRVNPGFFDSRTNLTPAETKAAKAARRDPNNLYGAKSFRNTGQSGIMNMIRSGGLLGSLARGIGQFFGLGKKPGEATYDMSEFNDLGLLTDRVNPTFQNDLGNELMLSTQKTPERFLPNAGPKPVNTPAGDAVSTLASSKFNRMKGYTDDYPNLGLITPKKEIPTVNGVPMINTGSVYQDNLDFFENLNKGIVVNNEPPMVNTDNVMQGSVLDAQPKKGIMQMISDAFISPVGADEFDMEAFQKAGADKGFFGANDELEAMKEYYDAAKSLSAPGSKFAGATNPNEIRSFIETQSNIPFGGGSYGVNMDMVPTNFMNTTEDFTTQKDPLTFFADGGLASMFTRRGIVAELLSIPRRAKIPVLSKNDLKYANPAVKKFSKGEYSTWNQIKFIAGEKGSKLRAAVLQAVNTQKAIDADPNISRVKTKTHPYAYSFPSGKTYYYKKPKEFKRADYITKRLKDPKFIKFAEKNFKPQKGIKFNDQGYKSATGETLKDIVRKYERTLINDDYIKLSDIGRILEKQGMYGPSTLSSYQSIARDASPRGGLYKTMGPKQIKKIKILFNEIDRILGKPTDLNSIYNLPEYSSLNTTKAATKGDFENARWKMPDEKKIGQLISTIAKHHNVYGLNTETEKLVRELYNNKTLIQSLKNYKGGKLNRDSELFKEIFLKNPYARSYALMKLGKILHGEAELDGIKINKPIAKKIMQTMMYDASKRTYGPMYQAAYRYAQEELRPFINSNIQHGQLAEALKKKFRKYGLTKLYNIDEVFPMLAGNFNVSEFGKGANAYSMFSQIIDANVNQVSKKIWDGQTGQRTRKILQALKDKNFTVVNDLVNEHKESLKQFYKNNPTAKGKVALQDFNFNPETNTFATPREIFDAQFEGRYESLNPNLRKNIEKFYNKTGLSIDVGNTPTIEELREVVDTGQIDISKGENITKDAYQIIKKTVGQNIIARATNNDDNVCEAVFGIRGQANGGPVGGGCGKQMELEFDKAPEQTLNKIAQSTNPNLKSFAQRALSLFPKLGTVGKIGTVAAGAGIALSGLRFNPEKGEIVTTDNDQKADQNQILQYVKDNPLKVTAGSSLGFAAQEVPGAYKAARDLGRGRVRSTLGISGAIRPVLTTFGTPLLTGLYEGAIGAKRLEEGETMTDVLTDPLGPALGISLMEPLSKMSGVVRDAKPVGILGGLKRAFNPFDMSNVGTARPGLTSKILRMGMSPRVIAGISRLGPYGMLAGAGLSALDQYNKYQNQEGMIYNLFND